jgi:hypothetical protein
MKGAKRELLAARVNVIVVDASKGNDIPEQVASYLVQSDNPPSSLLILGFGSSDMENFGFVESPSFREAAIAWCSVGGGRFLVQGERCPGQWPTWFGKEWKDADYFRTDHKCFAVGSDAVHW